MSKTGPYTLKEREYIEKHHKTKTGADIATVLKRNPGSIAKYIKTNFATSFEVATKGAEYDIKGGPMWRELTKQFDKDELDLFLYHWGRIISQFKDDVYPTEQLQVVDCVKLELLMNRALVEQNKCVSEIKLCEKLLNEEQMKGDLQDLLIISNLERQIGILRAAQTSLNSDYRDLLNKKGGILKEMKATRDARIKHIESYKHSFSGWLLKLLENGALRKKLGQDMEKMRLATDAEYVRLSEYHTYMDGQLDQPLLNTETVEND